MSRLSVLQDTIGQAIFNFIKWAGREIPIVRTIVHIIDPVNRFFIRRIKSDIHVADASTMSDESIRIDIDTGVTPALMKFKIPVDNHSADDILVSGIDLRFGLKKHGDEIGHLQWDNETGLSDPQFLVRPTIRKKTDKEVFRVVITPPPYVYRRRSEFSIHVSGKYSLIHLTV